MIGKLEAILAITPNAEVSITKDENGNKIIDWLDTTPISDSDIDAKIVELETAETNEATAKATAKASGNTKLLGLGLSQEEATALTGYTPE